MLLMFLTHKFYSAYNFIWPVVSVWPTAMETFYACTDPTYCGIYYCHRKWFGFVSDNEGKW